MLYDASIACEMAKRMLEQGVYVVVFFYLFVPKGKARIRVQMSSAHSREDLDYAINAFIECSKEMKIF